MEPVSIDDVRPDEVSETAYREFLREESLSVGLYTIPTGGTDPQTPHAEDEVYHVLSGRATIDIADDSYPVAAGDVVFVERGVDHRFVDVEATLTVLVFFAPAEGTLASA